jgi:hypothetical protein
MTKLLVNVGHVELQIGLPFALEGAEPASERFLVTALVPHVLVEVVLVRVAPTARTALEPHSSIFDDLTSIWNNEILKFVSKNSMAKNLYLKYVRVINSHDTNIFLCDTVSRSLYYLENKVSGD